VSFPEISQISLNFLWQRFSGSGSDGVENQGCATIYRQKLEPLLRYLLSRRASANKTFHRPQPQQQQQQQSAPSNSGKKPPRKLEMRMPNNGASPTNITFSAPFLDNTLAKLLTLQNRMLTVSNDIAACEDVDDKTKQEQFAQSAELSRIIALICAEKARQGA
jgi:hypothetical protein